MIKHQILTTITLLPFLLLENASIAQNLTLLEPVEVFADRAEASTTQAREQRALPNAPAFTLAGTSRIGGKQKASLVDSNGQVINVVMTDADSTPIPGHVGYRLVRVDSRRVAISLPADTPCIGSSDKGVECSTDGLAQLSLTTAAPIAVAQAPDATEQVNGERVAENSDEEPENPFAAALRAAAQNEAATRGRGGRAISERFEVQRIAPEDVPPGKRVVRTPFGDRLVDL